jgi:hypothetical protein
MAITQKITCDICNATRGIDNHWFLATLSGTLTFGLWNDVDAIAPGVKHICSSTCAAKLIDQDLK